MSKTVAVIGASSDRRKYGNKALRAFERRGYRVVPVNPNEDRVEGMRTYPTVLDYPEAIDIASLYVPSDIGERVVVDIARKKIPELWVNPGAESPALLARARALGLQPILACSILAINEDPSAY
ncbi:MAG: CoA-binding protein [Acidobacteria bacterium]|nr:CoA-binding protein [Acidobacteriota bacterium]